MNMLNNHHTCTKGLRTFCEICPVICDARQGPELPSNLLAPNVSNPLHERVILLAASKRLHDAMLEKIEFDCMRLSEPIKEALRAEFEAQYVVWNKIILGDL